MPETLLNTGVVSYQNVSKGNISSQGASRKGFFGFERFSESLKIPEEKFHQIGTSPAWGLQGLDL